MYEGRLSSARRVVTAACFALLLAPAAALAQFTVGAGGSIVNDTGSAAYVNSFDTASAHIFGEVEFDKWGLLQVRLMQFGLPGSASDAPNIRVQAGTISVAYLFQEEWWRGGFYLGGGIYSLKPNALEPGQVSADAKETAWGITGGLLSIFEITPRWDVRLEVGGHALRTDADHKPIFITGAVGYHF